MWCSYTIEINKKLRNKFKGAKMKVAYLSNTEKNRFNFFKPKFAECIQFEDLALLMKSETEFSAILLDSFDDNELIDLLKKIRMSDKYFLMPVFFNENIADMQLSDGNLEDISSLLSKAESINSLVESLDKRGEYDWKSKLLAYLFTRSDVSLIPKISWKNKYYYYYPLIEVFTNGTENYLLWINDLIEQEILLKKKLVDHFFCCSKCMSPHLKFAAKCPECGGANTKTEDFLHCFTCGYNAPEKEFLKDERLICPRCRSKLKLFGSDYDRPLETGICLDCNTAFIEADLNAECMVCGEKHSAEQLMEYNVPELTLTKQGRNKVQYDFIDAKEMFIDNINYVHSDIFVETLSWIIEMQRRFPDQFFSVLGFRVPAIDEGNYNLYYEVFKKLKSSIRSIDVCTRSHTGIIWIILPMTDTDGVNIVMQKLEKIMDDFALEEEEIKLEYNIFTSTQKNVEKMSATLLLSQMAGEL